MSLLWLLLPLSDLVDVEEVSLLWLCSHSDVLLSLNVLMRVRSKWQTLKGYISAVNPKSGCFSLIASGNGFLITTVNVPGGAAADWMTL